MTRAMGIDPVEGCGKTWKDALLQEEVANAESDPHTAIKELAEAAGKCLDCGGKGFTHNLHTEDGIAIPSGDCAPCAGTGRSIPFASLRVKCKCFKASPYRDSHRRIYPIKCRPCALVYGNNIQLKEAHSSDCEVCRGGGWVPEPDVRVACWEIFENHPEIIRHMMERPDLYGKFEVKEAVLRAALAWAKEQHGSSK